MPTPDQMNARISSEGATSLAVIHLRYDMYRKDAIGSGSVKVVNEQIYDVNGKNPYEQKMLFAVAPKEKYYHGKTIRFKFSSNLFVNNTGRVVKNLQVNFNNEGGYRTASWNNDITHTFSSTGIKDIYFRITYTDNTTYTCRTKISIGEEPPVTLKSADLTSDIPASSRHSGGKIQIKYAEGNTSQKIRKPLIIAEGFDPSHVLGTTNMDITNLSIRKENIIGTLNIGDPNIWENISSFDIIYLDYNDGLDDIRRNAALFQEVIDYVNRNKKGASPNVVMGISMGGLVARYALRKMELENRKHDTWKFISVDSPHKGANVPIGMQAMLRHLADVKFSVAFIKIFQAKNIDMIKKGLEILDSKAAKQMLVYHVDSRLQIDGNEHNAFQTEYDNVGFPLQCENVAITNGTGNGTKVMEPGTMLVDHRETYKFSIWMHLLTYYYGKFFLLTNFPKLFVLKIPGSANVVSDVKIHAAPNRNTSNIYWGRIRIHKKILFLINIKLDISEKSMNSNAFVYPLDGAPAGIYNVSNVAGKIPDGLLLKNYFSFVPTVSALALSDWQSQLNSRLTGQNLHQAGKTKFMRSYMPASNQEHTHFQAAASFLVREINSVPTDVVITGTVNIHSDRQYDRDIIVKSGATLRITNGATLDVSAKKITVEPGGKLIIDSRSKLYCKNLDIASGGHFSFAPDAMYGSR